MLVDRAGSGVVVGGAVLNPPTQAAVRSWRADVYTMHHPTRPQVSWLEYFGDIDEFGVEVLNPSDKMAAELVNHGARILPRAVEDFAAMDTDSGQMSKVAIEAKGLAINIKPSAPWQNTVSFTEPSVIPKKIPATAPDGKKRVWQRRACGSAAVRVVPL